MSERPFHCIPGEQWLADETLNAAFALNPDAEIIFRRLADASDRDWLVRVSNEDDPMAYAGSLRRKLFDSEALFLKWDKRRINAALSLLLARSCLSREVHGEEHYIGIAERLRYRRDATQRAGRKPAPAQQDLSLQGEMVLLPDAAPPPRIRVRVDKKENRTDVPPAREPMLALPAVGSDDDDNEDLASLPTVALEARLREAGVKMQEEEDRWRRKCKERGYSEDEASWRRWLVLAIERKPMPKKRRVEPPAPPLIKAVEITDADRDRRSAELRAFNAGLRGGGAA